MKPVLMVQGQKNRDEYVGLGLFYGATHANINCTKQMPGDNKMSVLIGLA